MYTVICIAGIVLNIPFAKYMIKRLKEEGYCYPYSEKKVSERIRDIIPFIILIIIPIVHLLPVIIGAGTFANEKEKEDFYQELKTLLVKNKVIVDSNIVKTDVKISTDEKEETEAEKTIEEPIRTYQDARAYWYSQHESSCPTLPTTDELKSEEELGFQKKIGTRH